MRIGVGCLPPDVGGTGDLSIHDLMGEMNDPTKTIDVDLHCTEGGEQLTVIVDGYAVYRGEIAYLLDYNATTRKAFMNIMRGDEWEYRQRYDITRIGHPTLPPCRERHEKWSRW